MPNIKAFEDHSDAYDQWFDKNHDLYEAELATLRQLVPSGSKGLEVGVGSGKFAQPLGIKTGVEPSVKMAIKARERGIDVIHGVAEHLPFADASFDSVLMVTTICFVDDILQAFREAFRVLTPGGAIIIGFVDKESRLGRDYEQKQQTSKFYQDAHFFSAREVLNYLEQAGFSSLTIKQTLISAVVPFTILDGFGKGAFVAIKGVK